MAEWLAALFVFDELSPIFWTDASPEVGANAFGSLGALVVLHDPDAVPVMSFWNGSAFWGSLIRWFIQDVVFGLSGFFSASGGWT